MKIYLAGPLFTEAEQNWLRDTKQQIESFAKSEGKDIEVIWPYELLDKDEVHSLGAKAKYKVFDVCKKYLEESDLLIALLDGPQVDDGTAWEIGYFYAINNGDSSKIVGVRTDFRRAGESENSIVNAMIEVSCSQIVHSSKELLKMLIDSLG